MKVGSVDSTNTRLRIPIGTVLIDTWGMTTDEVGAYLQRIFQCWEAGTVGPCCPDWVRKQWAAGVATNFRGLRKEPLSPGRYYGAQWPAIRSTVLDRDRVCKSCGEAATSLDVHHRRPYREFSDPAAANNLANLVALCKPCHVRADVAYRNRGVLFGAG